jgi:hypothetical protein
MATNPDIEDVDRLADYTPVVSTSDFVIDWPVYFSDGEDPKDDIGILSGGGELTAADFEFVGNPISGLTGVYDGGTVTLDTAVSGTRVIIWSKRDPRRIGFFLEGKALNMTELDKVLNDFAVQMRDLDLRVKRALSVSVADYLDGVDPESLATEVLAAAEAIMGTAASVGTNLWAKPVISIQSSPPGGPATNARYLVAPSGTSGAFVGRENQVAEWSGSAWLYSGAPTSGQVITIQSDGLERVFLSGSWQQKSADLATFTHEETGGQAVGLGAKLSLDVNLMDFIPKTLWAGIESGAGTTDLSTYLAAACAAKGKAFSGVRVHAGLKLYFTQAVTIGGSASIAHALVCPDGRATLDFHLSGHAAHCLTLQGHEDHATVPGREFLPYLLSGFDIFGNNTGLDLLVASDTDGGIIERVMLDQSYRQGVRIAPTNTNWIENLTIRQVTVSKAGHDAFMFHCAFVDNFINDTVMEQIEVRGVAVNSAALGINTTTQKNQLGAAMSFLSQTATNGLIDGVTVKHITADAASNFAVANSSYPNINAIQALDGRSAHVIWGAGVPSANREFDRIRFLGTQRFEDLGAGTYTGGKIVNVDNSNVILHGWELPEVTGGTWSTLAGDFGAGIGNRFSSSDSPGAIARSSDDYLALHKQWRATGKVTDANGSSLQGSYDSTADSGNGEGELRAEDHSTNTLKQLSLVGARVRHRNNLGDRYESIVTATPEASLTGLSKAHMAYDITNGEAYIFRGTIGANTGWKLMTHA